MPETPGSNDSLTVFTQLFTQPFLGGFLAGFFPGGHLMLRQEPERHPQSGRFVNYLRFGCARLPAGLDNPLDTPAPGFDHPGSEENVGDIRVKRNGGMFAKQLFNGPTRWQFAGIPDHQPVPVNADLDRDAAGIVLVHQGVQHRPNRWLT